MFPVKHSYIQGHTYPNVVTVFNTDRGEKSIGEPARLLLPAVLHGAVGEHPAVGQLWPAGVHRQAAALLGVPGVAGLAAADRTGHCTTSQSHWPLEICLGRSTLPQWDDCLYS